jgi:hypothetical protein
MIALAGVSLMLTSCEYPYYGYGHGYRSNQQRGTVYGAAGGALLGGIIGNQSRRPLQGALIGGVLGGLAGNAIGASRDRSYFVRGGPVYGSRYSYGRPYYSGYRSPNYCYRPTYYRPGFGGPVGFGRPAGFGSPFGFGSGLGWNSRWY